jgi:hypothetical protein
MSDPYSFQPMTSAELAALSPRRRTVRVVGDTVVVESAWHQARHFPAYQFLLAEVDTPLALLDWIRHLHGKVWFDIQTCQDLITTVWGHFGWRGSSTT